MPRHLVILCFAAFLVLSGPSQAADISLDFESDCSALLGASVEVSVIASPDTPSLSAFQFDILFDPALLSVEAVTTPSSGDFSGVDVEQFEPLPGVLSLGGLNCGQAAGAPVELASITFTVVASTEVSAQLDFGAVVLLDASTQEVPARPNQHTILLVSVADSDCDLVADAIDNCPTDQNPAQTDSDSDGAGDICDCEPNDPSIFPDAPEVNDGLDNQCPGDLGYGLIDETSGNSGFHNPSDRNEYSWPPQAGATLYETARSDGPGFSLGCVVISTATTFLVDLDQPDPGQAFFYLNHAVAPNVGSWGQDSAGVERLNVCVGGLQSESADPDVGNEDTRTEDKATVQRVEPVKVASAETSDEPETQPGGSHP